MKKTVLAVLLLAAVLLLGSALSDTSVPPPGSGLKAAGAEAAAFANRAEEGRGGTLTLPAGITRLEAEVFEGIASREVILPDGVTDIGSRAFAGSEVRSINIPRSVTAIADDAFADHKPLVFITDNQTAEDYAAAHGIEVIPPADARGGSGSASAAAGEYAALTGRMLPEKESASPVFTRAETRSRRLPEAPEFHSLRLYFP